MLLAAALLLGENMDERESYACGPEQPPVRDITMGQLLQEAAEECPARVALVAGVDDPAERRQWTYAELYEEALVVARSLRSRFKTGERVAVWAHNIPEWVLMEFGSALAGTVMVTVNPAFQADEIAYVLKQSRSAGIFVLPEFRGNRMLQHVLDVRGDCPELREIIRFDEWAGFIEAGADTSITLPELSPGDPCMIQYTSGTTGFPKGALLHHRGLVNNGAHTADRMGAGEGGVVMGNMPLFHTGGCVLAVLACVAKKSTLVLVPQFDPGLVLELMETYRANAMLGVPTMLVAMLEHPDFPSRDLSSVKAICSGGSTVPAALVQRFEDALGAPFTIVFGQTECSPVASMTRASDSIEDKAETLGGPMPGALAQRLASQSSAWSRVMRNQLGGWACQARPLRLFRSAQRFIFEALIEIVAGCEDMIDDACDLQGDESAGDLDGFGRGAGSSGGSEQDGSFSVKGIPSGNQTESLY